MSLIFHYRKKENCLNNEVKFVKILSLLSKKERQSCKNDKPVDVDNFVEIGDFFGVLRRFFMIFTGKDVEKSSERFFVYPKRYLIGQSKCALQNRVGNGKINSGIRPLRGSVLNNTMEKNKKEEYDYVGL